MTHYNDHPLSDIFPLMEGPELQTLADDIRANGLRQPIILWENQILDGRNRQRACRMADIEPVYRVHQGNSALEFVISANLHRRHLTESQRALAASKIANFRNGVTDSHRQTANLPLARKTQEQAAKMLNVSPRSVRNAKEVLEKGTPEQVKAVQDGKKTVHKVQQEIKGAAKEPAKLLDQICRPVPEEIRAEWMRAETVGDELRALCQKIKNIVAKAKKDEDPVFVEISNASVTEADSMRYSLSQVIPHAVCPTCHGKLPPRKSCQQCRRRGWISKHLWNTTVPETTRRLLSK